MGLDSKPMPSKPNPRPDRRHLKVDPAVAGGLFNDFEIGLSRAVLAVNRRHVGALLALGTALTAAGRHREALEADLKTVAVLKDDATAWYNLACSFSNLSRIDEALETLRKAVDLGYRDFPYLLKDPDLENVRRDPRFREILNRKWGKRQPS